MTRKHFVAIAATVKAKREVFAEPAYQYVIDDLARGLADNLAQTNGSFNRARFLAACGVTA